jgi:hypothetical protein
MAVSLGKMPTTSVRRLISPLRRSIGLVECSLARCEVGKLKSVGTNELWKLVQSGGAKEKPERVRSIVIAALNDIDLLFFALARHAINQTVLA